MAQLRGLPGSATPWVMLAAIVVVSLNFRGTIVSPSPVLGFIREDLQLSGFTAGLLTSIPVLFFGLGTPLAAAVIARTGSNRAVSLTLVGVLIGTLIRSAGTAELALAGTVVIGMALTIGNVVLPVIIRRDFTPSRRGTVMGAYAAAMNVGSLVTSLLTAPLATAFGWQLALATWSVLAVLALAVWGRVAPHGAPAATLTADSSGAPAAASTTDSSGAPATSAPDPAPSAWRLPIAWILTAGFVGQAFAYYGMTAWLPTMLRDMDGQSVEAAGASSSLFQIFGAVGALMVPVLATRLSATSVAAVVAALWLPLPLGLLLMPSGWALWCSFGGIAQGGGITIVFIIMMRLARNEQQARGLSAMVQGGGYGLASLGPLAVGTVYDATGDWLWPLMTILAAVLVMAAGSIAGGVVVERGRPQ